MPFALALKLLDSWKCRLHWLAQYLTCVCNLHMTTRVNTASELLVVVGQPSVIMKVSPIPPFFKCLFPYILVLLAVCVRTTVFHVSRSKLLLKAMHTGDICGLCDRVVLHFQLTLTICGRERLRLHIASTYAGQRTHHGECVQTSAQFEGCQGGAGVGGTAAVPGTCAP